MSSSIQNALDAIRARELARLDDLTGLYNDRYFHTRLTDEIARAERDGTDLSVLFIDLDDFKEVNDSFGHLAGSRTLREVGQLLRERARRARCSRATAATSSSSSCRAPNLPRALAIGEALRKAIGEASFFEPSSERDAQRDSSRHRVDRGRVVSRPPGAGRNAAPAREHLSEAGGLGDVPRQGERPQPRRDRRARGVGSSAYSVTGTPAQRQIRWASHFALT